MSNQTYATVVYTAAHHKRSQLALKKLLHHFRDFFKTVSSNLAWPLYFSSPIPLQFPQSPHVLSLRADIFRIAFNTMKV